MNGTISRDRLIHELLSSPEPSIRWKVRVGILQEPRDAAKVERLEREIRGSPRVRALLTGDPTRPSGVRPRHPYAKWQGAHWVLAALADIGYPQHDPQLAPLVDRSLELWLGPYYQRMTQTTGGTEARRPSGIPVIRGRARSHASQQGNALWSLTTLGLGDERVEGLVRLLRQWQWPDGGWNCDRDPEATVSSFMETLLPMRGLALRARSTGDSDAA
ncbi:MAG: hypothetical protein ACREDE_08510, partial [Thermoplasmata archaeon]